VALTAKQRNALPRSAFVYPASRSYPAPTKAQARAAGIGEAQRMATLRNALSRAGQSGTRGSYGKVARTVRARAGERIATVSRAKGTVHRPGLATRARRR
jgi:hypothetical protein